MTSPLIHRHATFTKASIDEKARTVALSFSSPTPVENGDGYLEILEHGPGADLSRLQGGALLLDHDPKKVLGRVESASITGGKGRALVRFGKGPLAEEIWTDVIDGIRDQVSFGYRHLETKVGNEKGKPVLHVSRWAGIEISIVGIAADPSVGIGRALNTVTQPNNMKTTADPSNPYNETVADIRQAFENCHMPAPEEITLRALNGELDITQFRAAIVKHYKDRLNQRPSITPSSMPFEVNNRSESSKGLTERMFADPEFQRFASRGGKRSLTLDFPDILSVRAALTLSGSGLFNTDNTSVIVPYPQERLTIADLFTQGTTTAGTVSYAVESAFTNDAATVAEAGAKPEITIGMTPATAPVRKIAAWTKVSDEMLADVPAASAFINMRLRSAVELREEAQLLSGDGSGANLTGILNTSGIQTQAIGVLSKTDALYKALTKIRKTARVEPDGFVFHPDDWETIMLLKDGENQYLTSVPALTEMGGQIKTPALWGKPVVVTTSQTQGTVLAGSFKQAAILYRRTGVTVESTNTNGTDFLSNMVTILCEERLSLAVMLPVGFVQITGF